jgi:hypothetical protein
MPKISKAEAQYSIGHQNSHCGRAFEADTNFCRHFIPPLSRTANPLGTCERVVGPISPVFWCRLFAKVQNK